MEACRPTLNELFELINDKEPMLEGICRRLNLVGADLFLITRELILLLSNIYVVNFKHDQYRNKWKDINNSTI